MRAEGDGLRRKRKARGKRRSSRRRRIKEWKYESERAVKEGDINGKAGKGRWRHWRRGK